MPELEIRNRGTTLCLHARRGTPVTGDDLWPAAVAALAVGLTLGVLWVWRRLRADDPRPQVRVLGQPSPLLTWLRYGTPPRLRPPAAPWARLAWLAALLLAGASLAWFRAHPSRPAWPAAGFLAAGSLMAWLARRVGLEAAPALVVAAPLTADRRRWGRALAGWGLSAGLSAWCVWAADRPHTGPADYGVALLWVVSVGLFLAGTLALTGWRPPAGRAVWAWWQAHRREAAALGALLALAFGLRVWLLTEHPYAMANDEGEAGYAALRLLWGEDTNLFKTGWSSQPLWSFLPAAAAIQLLGPTLLAVRLVSALEGTLAVAALYLLAREAFGRTTALLAGACLAGLAWHQFFSRAGYHNVIDSLNAPLGLWLVYRALRRGQVLDYAWAGLAAGLMLYAYVGSRLVLPLMGGLAVFGALAGRVPLRRLAPHALVFAGLAAVTLAPMAAHFYRHPDEMMARMNAVSLLDPDRLRAYADDAGLPVADYLARQVMVTTRVFVAGEGYGLYFNSPRPYFPFLAAVGLVLGVVYAAWHTRQPRYLALNLWLWAVVIFGGVLTSGAPSHQRLIMAAPAAALLAALGVQQAARLAARVGLLPGRAALGLAGLIIVLTATQGTAFFFGAFRTGPYMRDAAEEFGREVAQQAARLGPDYRLVLLSQPSVGVDSGNFLYLAHMLDKQALEAVTQASVLALPRDKGLFLAATPNHEPDLRRVAQWLPGGAWSQVQRHDRPGVVSYYGYVLPPP